MFFGAGCECMLCCFPSVMSADLDLSPPEVPEPTLFESLLRYGLFLGAIFQLICVLAIIIPSSKSHEQVRITYSVTNICNFETTILEFGYLKMFLYQGMAMMAFCVMQVIAPYALLSKKTLLQAKTLVSCTGQFRDFRLLGFHKSSLRKHPRYTCEVFISSHFIYLCL